MSLGFRVISYTLNLNLICSPYQHEKMLMIHIVLGLLVAVTISSTKKNLPIPWKDPPPKKKLKKKASRFESTTAMADALREARRLNLGLGVLDFNTFFGSGFHLKKSILFSGSTPKLRNETLVDAWMEMSRF